MADEYGNGMEINPPFRANRKSLLPAQLSSFPLDACDLEALTKYRNELHEEELEAANQLDKLMHKRPVVRMPSAAELPSPRQTRHPFASMSTRPDVTKGFAPGYGTIGILPRGGALSATDDEILDDFAAMGFMHNPARRRKRLREVRADGDMGGESSDEESELSDAPTWVRRKMAAESRATMVARRVAGAKRKAAEVGGGPSPAKRTRSGREVKTTTKGRDMSGESSDEESELSDAPTWVRRKMAAETRAMTALMRGVGAKREADEEDAGMSPAKRTRNGKEVRTTTKGGNVIDGTETGLRGGLRGTGVTIADSTASDSGSEAEAATTPNAALRTLITSTGGQLAASGGLHA